MRINHSLLVIVFLFLAASVWAQKAPENHNNTQQVVVNKPKLNINPWPEDQSSCEVHKGIWIFPMQGKITRAGHCNLPTTDAEKECSDSSQCQGGCLQRDKSLARGVKTTGHCSTYLDYDENGCFFTV